jgi:hypothetical protein
MWADKRLHWGTWERWGQVARHVQPLKSSPGHFLPVRFLPPPCPPKVRADAKFLHPASDHFIQLFVNTMPSFSLLIGLRERRRSPPMPSSRQSSAILHPRSPRSPGIRQPTPSLPIPSSQAGPSPQNSLPSPIS